MKTQNTQRQRGEQLLWESADPAVEVVLPYHNSILSSAAGILDGVLSGDLNQDNWLPLPVVAGENNLSLSKTRQGEGTTTTLATGTILIGLR